MTTIDRPVQPIKAYMVPFWRRPGFYLGLILLVNLMVGINLVTSYGESWDEPPRIDYSYRSLAAYRGQMTDLSDEKGPFFGMVQILGGNVLGWIFPGWEFIHTWHFMIFLSYLLGTFFFYRLCRRLVEGWPALAATLLFCTQPLIWGHAFMNPKDLPFTVFFMGSVTMGLEMADHFFPRKDKIIPPVVVPATAAAADFIRDIRADWAAAPRRLKKGFAFSSIASLVLAVTYPLVTALIRWFVTQAYSASPGSFLGEIFTRYLKRPVDQPVSWYVDKLLGLYRSILTPVGAGLVLLTVGLAFLLFPTFSSCDPGFLKQPGTWIANKLRNFWSGLRTYLTRTITAIKSPARAKWFKRAAHFVFDPRLWIAGSLLGFANDIRTLGPASGALVAVYLLAKGRKRAIPVLMAYLVIGGLVTYLCWPYLWRSPVLNYIHSASQAAGFAWNSTILFGGLIYKVKTLPSTYIPTLFTIQFTEPALLVGMLGAALALVYFHRRPSLRMDILLLVTWFAAPVTAAMILHSTVYDNARQFLFVVPPIFVLGSFALQNAWIRLKPRLLWFVPLSLLLIAPAVYWIIRLHPYEYIYYNSLVGGVQGAFRSYENDYWALSYKEGMAYINQIAPLNARVYVYGPLLSSLHSARPDLKLTDQLNQYPDVRYALIMTKRNIDQRVFPESKTVFQVTRENVILSVVKQVEAGDIRGSDIQLKSTLP